MTETKLPKKQPTSINNNNQDFIASDAKPINNISNPYNLFDDSNQKDKKWLKIAHNFLSRGK